MIVAHASSSKSAVLDDGHFSAQPGGTASAAQSPRASPDHQVVKTLSSSLRHVREASA